MGPDITSAEALRHPERRSLDARFVAALGVSVVVHLTTLAMLGDAVGGPHAGAFSWSARIDRPLEVAFSPPRVTDDAETRAATAVAVSPAVQSAATPKESPPPTRTVVPQPAAREPLPEAGPTGHGLTPRVIVNDRVPRARLGESLDGDTLSTFPVEVDSSVVLPGKLEVPYPPAALAAQREDTVLVWAIVDAQGAVEETHIVEGTPEFAAAVEAALSTMHLIPAHDLGQNIRYYVTLEFAFRIEGAGTPSAAAAAATESR